MVNPRTTGPRATAQFLHFIATFGVSISNRKHYPSRVRLVSWIAWMQPSVSSGSDAASTGRIQTCIGCIREYDERSMKKINSAQEGTNQKDTWMCVCCKRLRERIQGVVASGECEGLTYDSKEEKAAFFVEAHALMGTELKMKMKDQR